MLYVSVKYKISRLKIFNISFDGRLYQSVYLSSYSHDYAGLANYKNQALTTGCAGNIAKDCFVQSELLDMETLRWSYAPNYPFANDSNS